MIRSFTINKQNWCACGDVLWLHFHLFRERKRSKWSHIKQNIHLSCYFIIVVSLFSLVFHVFFMFLSKHFGFSFYLIIKQCIFIFADFLLLLICGSMNMSVLPEPLMSSLAMLHGGVRGILGKCRCRFFSTAEGHEEEDEWGRWAVHLTFGRFRRKSENAAFINKPGGVIPRVSWKNVKWFPVMVLLVHSTYFTYFISSIELIHYIDLIS